MEYSTRKQPPTKRDMWQAILVVNIILFASFMFMVVTKELTLTDGVRFFFGTALLVCFGFPWVFNSQRKNQEKKKKWTTKKALFAVFLFFLFLGLLKLVVAFNNP